MKKRVNEFFFGIYSCLGGRTIIGIFVYLLFLVLYFEKSFLMMCEYYQYTPDNLNSFIEYVFFNGYFIIMFFPIVVLVVAWRMYQFFCGDCLKLVRCKSRVKIIWRFFVYGVTISTGIMLYLLLCFFLVGKAINMHITSDTVFVSEVLFTYVSFIVMLLLYLLCSIAFSSNGMGVIGVVIPLVFELIVWKNSISVLRPYVFFYNIVNVDDENISISFIHKIVFWISCLVIITVLLLLVIQRVDLGASRTLKEVKQQLVQKYNGNPWYIGMVLWAVFYVVLTYHAQGKFFEESRTFLYVCFRGFATPKSPDMFFYLGLCLPLWAYLLYYFSRFFTTFSIYLFMKTGGVLTYMLKCFARVVRDTVIYFLVVLFVAYAVGNIMKKEDCLMNNYQWITEQWGGIFGVIIDFILATLLFVLFVMVLYLLFYRLDVAFLVGLACHIVNVIIVNFIPYGKELVPFTQHILLLREEGYHVFLARGGLCLMMTAVYILFCCLMRKKQEKILMGYYQ
ncbi:MAG: hypothetical protein J6D02_02950 [Lachnospira sp.]|nr:hypothetical protein [Lachnospira sp.]